MATVNKNFRIKNGLIVEGGTATVNGFGVLTKAQADQDYIVGLIGGTATSANTANTVVKRDANGNFAAGTITATFVGNLTGDVTGTVSSLSNHDTADLAENAANKYFTDARALSATAAAYDAAGSAAAVAGNLTTHTSATEAHGATGAVVGTTNTQTLTNKTLTLPKINEDVAVTATATELNILDGATLSTAELNYVDGVTSAIQTQIDTKAPTASPTFTGTVSGVTSTMVGLGNVDNTSDANKPVSTAAQAALDLKAPLASPALTGIPTAPTAAANTDTTQVATTAFVKTAVANLVDGAPGLLDTLNELAAAIGDDANFATTLTASVGLKANIDSPTFTGTVTLPSGTVTSGMILDGTIATADIADSAITSAKIADGTIVDADINASAAIAQSKVADLTTDLGLKAPLASPALTGVPTAPTAAADTSTTQIATTAFAKAEADAAQAAAISAAATDATNKANAAQAAAEATAAAANTAQQNGTTSFTAINYNSVAKQVAATTGNIAVAAETTAISWVAADYRSAKFVVKVKNGVHTQVSDLVVTLDTANNVAVSEYGITYSNGTELAAVTADYSGSDVRIRVTPANANTEVVVVGTLIK
jgi:hypothetical protein